MGEQTAVLDPRLGAEAVELLGELIRLDTSNPPGGEQEAQELLAARLGEAGFECELLAAVPGRPNLVATLAGEFDGPTLCLLGHVDTVPADPGEWSFHPWAGDVVQGEVRGRGAQDMKGQVAAEVSAAAALARDGWRPARGTLRVVITGDEETGGGLGARWLCETHPEKVTADLVVNEGGGKSFELGGRRFYALAVGEKGVARFRLRARGRAGHASIPGLGENALLKLAPALDTLREQPPLEPTEAGIAFLSALSDGPVEPESTALGEAVERLRSVAPTVAAYLAEPMLRVTLVPTKVHASEKDNVIPSLAESLVDCRVPPGMEADAIRERIDAVLGPHAGVVEVEFTEVVVGTSSPLETPLKAAIQGWLADVEPGAEVVPIVMPGFSDSHWFRKAFGAATVYGFSPQRELDLIRAEPLFHAADERAAVADVELAASFFAELPRRVLG